MIIVTGAAGFIGSYLVGLLNEKGYQNIVLVDHFRPDREANLMGKKALKRIDRNLLFDFIEENHLEIEFVFHLGARTDTTLFDVEVFDRLNLNYSKSIWNLCCELSLPLIYASSAATYGDGTYGYDDSVDDLDKLQPLNPYGWSKHNFDLWVKEQNDEPPFWAGFKFFNVYGPNEYHKGRMASVIFHAFNQIKDTGALKLFKSHRPEYSDGGQMRDFIYVRDLCETLIYFFENRTNSGLYNLGTGNAETFKALGEAVFKALSKPVSITYVDTPVDIRDKYQYFTEADMSKVRSKGYNSRYLNLEEGVDDYVKNFLQHERRF